MQVRIKKFKLQSKEIIEISGKKVGIIHPSIGGPDEKLEDKVLSEFADEDLDIITYGHSHYSKIIAKENLLLVNPGKGYLETNYFSPPTTIVILIIDNEEVRGEIKEIKT